MKIRCRRVTCGLTRGAVVLGLASFTMLAELRPLVSAADVASVPSEEELIHAVWRSAKWDLARRMRNGLSKGSAIVLYDVQVQTNLLLEHAAAWGDRDILHDLAELYLVAYDYLERRGTYRPAFCRKGPDLPLSPPARMWLEADGTLSRLHVSQFLYLLSRAVCIICDVRAQDRTDAMNRPVAGYVPVLKEHYTRWVCCDHGAFRGGFGGEKEFMNHHDYLKRKFERPFSGPKICNAVFDIDMWIVAGVVELLGAHQREPALVPLTPGSRPRLLDYVRLATTLIKSRLTESRLTDFAGKPVTGLNFDLGQWDDWRDYAYSGYTGATFPTGKDKARAKNVGWDISHARRFVHVFETLLRHRDVTGQAFPTRKTLVGLANQLIYAAFNRDFEGPLFTNFMSGTNGWYRVGFKGQATFGYAPYRLSNAVPTGGYLTWVKYNPDVGRVAKALRKMIRAVMADFVVDESGNRRHAQCSGITKTERDGGDALQFDAGKGCIDGGIDAGLCTGKGSAELWFRLNTLSAHHDLFYLFETPYKDFLLISRNRANTLYLMIEDDDERKLLARAGTLVTDTDWHHLVVTQDGSGARMFLDGTPCKLKGANSGNWTRHLVLPRLWIGKGHLKANLDGCIDDVRIYDRALSDSEIVAHFEGTFPDRDHGLIACWNGRILSASRGRNVGTTAFVDEYYAYPNIVSKLRHPFSVELLQFLASMSVAHATER